jgi:hypothetical protein
MSIRLARWGLTAVVVAALLAPEALLLHRCPCGRILDCCCRSLAAHRGQSCHLGPAKGHCSARPSEGIPASVQSWRESIDRVGTWEPQGFAVPLPATGWIAEPNGLAADSPSFEPPIPPPRPA